VKPLRGAKPEKGACLMALEPGGIIAWINPARHDLSEGELAEGGWVPDHVALDVLDEPWRGRQALLPVRVR
jgi:hypothetical protein